MWVGGQRHAPAVLTQERPGTHYTAGWVGFRVSLDGGGKLRPHRDSIPRPTRPKIGAVPTAPQRSERCNGKQMSFLIGNKYCKLYCYLNIGINFNVV